MTIQRNSELRLRAVAAAAAACVLLPLAGCPKDPKAADTWIDKLGDQRSVKRAAEELEKIQDPKAIAPLGAAWEKHGYPPMLLQTLIVIADQEDRGTVQSFSVDEKGQKTEKSKDDFEYEQSEAYGIFWKEGPYWKEAVPVLIKAVNNYIEDEGSDTAFRNARAAVNALVKAKDPSSVDVLIALINKNMASRGQHVRRRAIQALGSFKSDPRVVKTLIGVLNVDKKDQRIELYAVAADSLAKVGGAQAVIPLIKTMFRLPPLYPFVRRAMVSIGEPAVAPLIGILEGKNKEVNKLADTLKFAVKCNRERNWGPKSTCRAPKNLEYKSSLLLGELRAQKAVAPLVSALAGNPMPAYFEGAYPGPPQQEAILQALRKIGSPKAVGPVRAYWKKPTTPSHMKALGIDVYSYLTPDASELPTLAKIICDRKGDKCLNDQSDQNLRLGAAKSHALLVRSKADTSIHLFMRKRYRKAVTSALGPEKKAKAAHEKAVAAEKAARKAQQAAMDKASKDPKNKALEKATKTAGAKLTKAEGNALEKAQAKKAATNKVLGLTSFQRGFEQHLARAYVGIKCKKNVDCYIGMLDKTPEQIRDIIGKELIPDFDKWKKTEKEALRVAAIERACLELGKMGKKANKARDALLKHAGSKTMVVREAVYLALPRIVAAPCEECAQKIEQFMTEQKGDTSLSPHNLEALVMKYFFETKK